jgi:HSP20 family protein
MRPPRKGGEIVSIVRWQPFSDMVTLRQAMDRLFEDSFVRPPRFAAAFADEGNLPIDMYQTNDSVVVRASVPGVKPEEVEVTITGDMLTIKGETRAEEEVKKDSFFRQEISYGAFSRSVVLPSSLQPDKAEATFENGVLTLTIPKAEATKPKQIKIKPKNLIEGKKTQERAR